MMSMTISIDGALFCKVRAHVLREGALAGARVREFLAVHAEEKNRRQLAAAAQNFIAAARRGMANSQNAVWSRTDVYSRCST